MEYNYDAQTDLVSIKFKIRTGKIEEAIIGCQNFCKSKDKGKGIEFQYKRKEKKNKVFYRIKISGPPKEIIFVIKQLDCIKQLKGIHWDDVIKRIKEETSYKKNDKNPE